MNVKIVIPYININEVIELNRRLSPRLPVFFWEDTHRIGSDLAYQTLWNMFPDDDIIILHSDMLPMEEDINNQWYYDLLDIVDKHPEAGIFGMTLLYPAKDQEGNYYIQHAGGRFENGEAIHFGGGLDIFSSKSYRSLESDKGQYDKLREVSWVTFGGIYIRRSVIAKCGDFDPSYYWTYYRDVDYCITARELGVKIYQTPIKLLHFEGYNNKVIQQQDQSKSEKIAINHNIFLNKWKNSKLLETVNIEIINE